MNYINVIAEQISHGGSQGFKSPHLHPTTDEKPPKPLPFPPPPATERAATDVRRECDHPATIRAHLVD